MADMLVSMHDTDSDDQMLDAPENVDVNWTPHGFDATITRVMGMPASSLPTVILVPVVIVAIAGGLNWPLLGLIALIATVFAVLMLRFFRLDPLRVAVDNGRLRVGGGEPIELAAGFRLGESEDDYNAGMHLWNGEGESRAYIELMSLDRESRLWLRCALNKAIRDVAEVDKVPPELEQLRRQPVRRQTEQ